MNTRKNRFRILVLGVVVGFQSLWGNPANEQNAQSATGPSSEASSASSENFLVNSGSMVNEFSGNPSFDIKFGSISSGNGIGFPIGMRYFGGVYPEDGTLVQFTNPSWVGEGFSFNWPKIVADNKGTVRLSDDTYYLILYGQSQKMVAVTGSVNHFVLENDPTILIKRTMVQHVAQLFDPYHSAANVGPPSPFFSPPVNYVEFWIVTLPNGTHYNFNTFKSDGTFQDGVLCSPFVSERIGYQSSYSFLTDPNPLLGIGESRFPDQWNISSITDRDGKFAINFSYNKISEWIEGARYVNAPAGVVRPKIMVDRAVYLLGITATIGIGANAEVTGEASFGLMDKESGDYYDNSIQDPLSRFEKKCLKSITLKSHGKTVREYGMTYGRSGNNKLRIEGITETEPVFAKTRPFYTFDFDGWRLTKVTDPKGIITEYTWGEAPLLKAGNAINLSPLSGAFPKGRLGLQFEYGNNFYLSVNAAAGCGEGGSAASTNQDRLFQFTNNGGYWELTRIFKAPTTNCGGKFQMAPDASYFLYFAPGTANSQIWVYDLPIKNNSSSVIPMVVDLLSRPSFMHETQFPGVGDNNELATSEILTFNTWFTLVSHVHKKISFFHKGDDGSWLDGMHAGDGSATGCVVPTTSHIGPWVGTRTGCITFNSASEIQVRPGSDFIGVVEKANGHSVVLIYGHVNGVGFQEHTQGLKRSSIQKGVSTPLHLPSPYKDDISFDFWNNFYETFSDISVSGNLIVLSVNDRWVDDFQGGNDFPFMVFQWDGHQLRYLYSEKKDLKYSVPDAFYCGPDYFVKKQYITAGVAEHALFYYYKVDLASGDVSKSGSLLSSEVPWGDAWTVKTMDDYFFIERASSESYEHPILRENTNGESNYWRYNWGDYRRVLFHINPSDRKTATPVSLSPDSDHNLGNVFIKNDKLMGVSMTTSETEPRMIENYYFGSRSTSAATANGNWHLQSLNPPSFYGSDRSRFVDYSYSLLSTGAFVAGFEMPAGQTSINSLYFNGSIRFVAEHHHALIENSVTRTSVVKSITVKTRGENSSLLDGSIRSVNLIYDPQGRSQFNAVTKAANFEIVEKDEIAGQNLVGKVTTTYLVDKNEGPLTLNDKNLHGLPIQSQYQSHFNSTTPAPEGGTQSISYRSLPFTAIPNRFSLDETCYLISSPTVTKRQLYTPGTAQPGFVETTVKTGSVDPFNGIPKVTVTQSGEDYLVRYTTFEHEFTPTAPSNFVRQTATYLFNGADPCANSSGSYDPCGNITDVWLLQTAQQVKAISSQITTYSSDLMPENTWEWRPQTLGTSPLQTLSGAVDAAFWVNVSSISERNRNVPAARAKDMSPTVTIENGVYTTFFHGGAEPNLLGKVVNASKITCALLNGEEASILANKLGSFGEWEPGGAVLSQEVVHSGCNSFKATQVYGPTVEIHFRGGGDSFWPKKKGFVVSGWIFAKGQKDVLANDPAPAFVVGLRNASGQEVKSIDLVGEYGPLPYNRWVKLERLITYDELKSHIPDAGAYLRVWVGKASSSNSNPVYSDDLRIYPSDAQVTTWNYNELQQVTSTLSLSNEPSFFLYDVWGVPVGAKDKRGIGYSAAAYKSFND